MKYLVLITLFLVGCSDKPNTAESCMLAVKGKLDFAKYQETASRSEVADIEMAILTFCEAADYDPAIAMQKIEALRYSH